jgi:hypothetical protein
MSLELIRDFVPLAQVAKVLPESYEALRLRALGGDLPTRRDENGRIFVERDFALHLADRRDEFDALSHAIAYVSHER